MGKNSKYFRELGWTQLQERWSEPVIYSLVYLIITGVVSGSFSVLALLLLPMGYSYSVAFLNDIRN